MEACALPYAYSWLLRAPRGEGRPVLVIPGFTNSDNATFFVRGYLRRLGYEVHGWDMGTNSGLSFTTYAALQQRLHRIYESSGQSVSLVGWSLGGFYARALANQQADQVRSVVSVATTFCMPTPKAVNRAITRLYGHLNPYQQTDEFFRSSELWETTPAVPSTSIYSKGDGINNWEYCIDKVSARAENVQVYGSHSGLAVNALVYQVLADRLAQDPATWRAYAAPKFVQQLRGKPAIAG
jgi:pimeloyl-ACP methyl ester carboxylesterase